MNATSFSQQDLDHDFLKNLEIRLFKVAEELNKKGPNWAQERIFLREVSEVLSLGNDLRKQQAVLASWQDLFRKGKLVWGYDLDNPGPPFFHIPAVILSGESKS